jgi:hypothetical protein
MTHEELVNRELASLRLQLDQANEKIGAMQRTEAQARIAAMQAAEQVPIVTAKQQATEQRTAAYETARRNEWTRFVVDSGFRSSMPTDQIVDPARIEKEVAAGMSREREWPVDTKESDHEYLWAGPELEPAPPPEPQTNVGKQLFDMIYGAAK